MVFVCGEDIGAYGGVFGTARGLQKEFGKERVFDTPISEEAIIGLGVGAAATGCRPVVDIMFTGLHGRVRRRDPEPDGEDALHVRR